MNRTSERDALEAALAAAVQTIRDGNRGLDSDAGGPVALPGASKTALTTAELAHSADRCWLTALFCYLLTIVNRHTRLRQHIEQEHRSALDQHSTRP